MTASYYCKINEQTELRLIQSQHGPELFQLIQANREYLRRWHPWVDAVQSPADIDRLILVWHQQHTVTRGFYAGVWFDGQLCGVISHLLVDWVNRWTAFSYWLAEPQQGQGIMTACCRAFIRHSFETWRLHRVVIECATENHRSRAIPERLGFKLDGIIRECELLRDRYVDHAVYSLLRSEWRDEPGVSSTTAQAPLK